MKGKSGRGTSSGKPSPAASKERSQNSKASCKITSNSTGSGGGGGGSNGGSFGGGGISKPLDNRQASGRVYDGGSLPSNLSSTTAAVVGEAGSRPLSAGKGHAPIGRKQALVKAVPRTDLPSHTEIKDKVNNQCN